MTTAEQLREGNYFTFDNEIDPIPLRVEDVVIMNLGKPLGCIDHDKDEDYSYDLKPSRRWVWITTLSFHKGKRFDPIRETYFVHSQLPVNKI